jgi:rRNA maturation endonuclease Nob1
MATEEKAVTASTVPATGTDASTTTPAAVTDAGTQSEQTTETVNDAERIKRMEEALKKANKEAEKYRKSAEAFEKAEQAKRDAELSETDKLRKQLAEAESKAATAERNSLVTRIAAEIGLPAILATRLQGADEEALREDAKQLLETIKAQPPNKQTRTEATLPTTAAKGETDTQRAERILRPSGGNPFDPENAKKNGGGVFINNGG